MCEYLEPRTLLSAVTLGAVIDGNPATETAVSGGGALIFDVEYESTGTAETTEGEDTVTVRLHYDSTALRFVSLDDELTGSDILVDPDVDSVIVESDTSDLDGNTATDSFVAITFASQSELPTPAALFTATFAAEADLDVQTVVNFTGDVDEGDTLQTTPLAVDIDLTPPQPVLVGPAGPIGMGAFTVDLDFGEDVSGFDPEDDLVLSNAEVVDFTGDNGLFTITLQPVAGGPVTVDVPAEVVEDAAGNGNLAATQYSVTAVEQDFGDAPDSYDTSAETNGPRHFPEGPTLGTERDTEPDAQTPLDGTGDDAFSNVTESILDAAIVTLHTNFGAFSIQLDPDSAPQTVANFLQYVTDGDYDNTIFHRLMSGFVLQGGGFETTSETFTNTSQFTAIPTDDPVENEFNRSNLRGTIAMAKLGGDPDSATSQFFFNIDDNLDLDTQNDGFTVFGELTDLTLLDQLAMTPTRNQGGAFVNLPVTEDDQLIVVRFAGVASASGTAYDDENSNGIQDAGETGLAGVTIYADINNNGEFDEADVFTTTDANGEYTLEGLPLGDVVIHQVLPVSTVQTQPLAGRAYTLTTSVGSVFEGVDFGSVEAIDVDGFIPGGDEDGVRISDDFRVITGTSESATVTIQNSNGEARLFAWIDFNGDGDFEDEGEQIADGTGDFANLGDGEVIVPFDVPTDFTGNTFARFRVSTDAELGIGGEVGDGEVEDYGLSIENEDNTPPTPVITGPTAPMAQATFDVTVDFGEAVGGFDESDIIVGNGTVTGLSGGGDGAFTVTISAMDDGEVTIDIPADAAVDAAGNSSLAAMQFAVTVDATPPLPVLTGPDESNEATFTVTIDFGETVTGFEESDIDVDNGTIDELTGGTDGVFTLTVTADDDGEVTINIPAGAAADEAGNESLAAEELSVTVDATPPVPEIDGPSSVSDFTFEITIDFGETVTGFDESDIIVGNGNVQSLTGGTDGVFTATIEAILDGEVTIDIPAGAAEDELGNVSEEADQFTTTLDTEPFLRRTAVGTGLDSIPQVRVFDPETGDELFSFLAYGQAFTGGVRVAVGDVTGDGVEDVITAPGPGGGPHIKVFNGISGGEVREFMAYSEAFTGGVYVAAGDIDRDGFADIITAAGRGGGPHVRVFSGQTGEVLRDYFAYSPAFTGGVRVAAGDINADGVVDIITSPGAGGGPHVKVFDGRSNVAIQSFMAFHPAFTGGVTVAAGDVNGDGFADIITGAGAGGGPHVRVYDGQTEEVVQDFFAYDRAYRGGVTVAAEDVNGDGRDDIFTGPGSGGPEINVFGALSTEFIRSLAGEGAAGFVG